LENGLARAHGTKRESPDGTAPDEMQNRLADMEVQAMLKKTGIWSATDPNEITRLREMQREEDREMGDLRKQLSAKRPEAHSIDLNSATSRELQMISGIGPVLATTIISNRPYSSVEDLQRVKGVGPKLFEQIRPYVMVRASSKPANTKP
jgi:competence ComEA-like helix-hairpin-helix protein